MTTIMRFPDTLPVTLSSSGSGGGDGSPLPRLLELLSGECGQRAGPSPLGAPNTGQELEVADPAWPCPAPP